LVAWRVCNSEISITSSRRVTLAQDIIAHDAQRQESNSCASARKNSAVANESLTLPPSQDARKPLAGATLRTHRDRAYRTRSPK
jgi:hypothetical protein